MTKIRKEIPDKQGKNKDSEVGYKKPPKETRWKPGQSGNPKGRPPSNSEELNSLLDEIFAEEVSDDRGNKMAKLRVALNKMLLGKNIAGAIHLLERRYGKIPQPLTVEGDKDKPLKVVIEYANDTDGNKT